ncbi:MAG: hypothetical protein KAJ23_13470 [Maribacter sp.]|nr:hypothetical protein [Maribacter sp.]
MGTQGATGAGDILLGTNTRHVIKKAACPILAVPSDFTYKTPTDFISYGLWYGVPKGKIKGTVRDCQTTSFTNRPALCLRRART